MKMLAVLVFVFSVCFQSKAQDYFFLTPIGKNLGEYREQITCVMAGPEFGQAYTEQSKCRSYRRTTSDSFRIDGIVFNLMFLHRDSGKIINAVSFNKSIVDEKKSKHIRLANEEFRVMSKFLDKFCGSSGKARTVPPVKGQEYKVTEWKRGLLKFSLQQVDFTKKKGFSVLEFFIQRSP